GVEVEYQQLVYWQKEIINKCRDAAKPVITATQMLHSMVNHPRPTRAEVSDVANAVYDGTDAVMLSEETTIGKYPIQAVKTQAEIVSYNEQHAFHDIQWPENTDSSLDITSNAANLLFHSSQKIDKIICFTETGRTVRLLSRFRPKQPIYTITHILDTYTKLTLTYGVKPYLIDFPDGKIEINDELITKFEQAGITKKGETVLFIHGTVWKKPGLTNTLALINT
ncbi:pyruvate kinase, partial [Patescibacteria group bacterium]|nr:pyruvate kinase [Patescibacteria group bacterium]